MRTSVDRDALDRFIEYAQGMLDRIIGEFCCSKAEGDIAQGEFDELTGNLRVEDII